MTDGQNTLQEDLRRILPEWQKRLRIQDWNIELTVVRWHTLDAQGRCTITQALKYAKIQILDFHDCPEPASMAYSDPEGTLVHELLHIPLDAANPDCTPSELIGLEQAINGIEHCLVALGRILPAPTRRS